MHVIVAIDVAARDLEDLAHAQDWTRGLTCKTGRLCLQYWTDAI